MTTNATPRRGIRWITARDLAHLEPTGSCTFRLLRQRSLPPQISAATAAIASVHAISPAPEFGGVTRSNGGLRPAADQRRRICSPECSGPTRVLLHHRR
jgi:hypothetical protein